MRYPRVPGEHPVDFRCLVVQVNVEPPPVPAGVQHSLAHDGISHSAGFLHQEMIHPWVETLSIRRERLRRCWGTRPENWPVLIDRSDAAVRGNRLLNAAIGFPACGALIVCVETTIATSPAGLPPVGASTFLRILLTTEVSPMSRPMGAGERRLTVTISVDLM